MWSPSERTSVINLADRSSPTMPTVNTVVATPMMMQADIRHGAVSPGGALDHLDKDAVSEEADRAECVTSSSVHNHHWRNL